MRVDLVTPRFHPSVGGIEESVTQLALGLQARGHDVLVHTARLQDWPPSETWRGIPLRRYPLVMDRGYYVSRFEPELEGDVIHLHAYAHQTNDWVLRRWSGQRPIVYSTHHGLGFPKKGLLARLYHWWYNRRQGLPLLRRVDRVLVPTRVDYEVFVRRGVAAARVEVVPSGVDEAAFRKHAPWRPRGVPAGFFLYLGRLHPEKGVLDLLEAYRAAGVERPLVFAGRDEAQLRDRLSGVAGVHVVEDLDARRKWGLLEACHALVLPSHYEGQGIVVAEAWAKKKAVLATRVGGLVAVVQDEKTGLLVAPQEPEELAAALRRLAKDERLARRLGAAGHQEAQSAYRWDAIVERVERVYLEAAKARR